MGLVVKSDGHGGMSVSLPRDDAYMSKVCGICGDFNDNKDDDWRIGPFTGCTGENNEGGQIVSIRHPLIDELIHSN